METTVKCSSCGTIFDEAPGGASEKPKPCPNCGSTSRDITIRVDELVIVTDLPTAAVTVFSAANLLLQTAVVSGEKTREGQLIEAVALPWFEIIELLKHDPAVAYRIPPQEMGGDYCWSVQESRI